MGIRDSHRVVIAHDYVTQRGGAERVALDLLRAFPGSRLVTSYWNAETSFPEFADFEIQTLGRNSISALRRDPRRAFPLLARAFEQHTITDADVVICSSSGWSHRVGTTGAKIVYCHNPARWLYQPEQYFPNMPAWAIDRFVAATSGYRRTDATAARSAAKYLVNSSVVANRVRSTYGIPAEVLAPARGVAVSHAKEPIVGIEPGFLLTIGRDRSYKRTEAVQTAVVGMPGERLVVVGGPPIDTPGVTRLTGVSDAQLRWLYANAAALVAVAHEDFGLTPVEAQAFGLPTVLLRSGGYLESGIEGATTIFVDDFTVESVQAGIAEFRSRSWDRELIAHHGQRYSFDSFAKNMNDVVDRVLDGESDEPAIDDDDFVTSQAS